MWNEGHSFASPVPTESFVRCCQIGVVPKGWNLEIRSLMSRSSSYLFGEEGVPRAIVVVFRRRGEVMLLSGGNCLLFVHKGRHNEGTPPQQREDPDSQVPLPAKFGVWIPGLSPRHDASATRGSHIDKAASYLSCQLIVSALDSRTRIRWSHNAHGVFHIHVT